MTTTVRLDGAKELQAALKRASADVKAAVSDAVEATALELRANVVKSLRKPGRGVTYYRIYDAASGYTNIFAGDSEGYVTSVKGRMNLDEIHRASAAGDPPSTDSGMLLSSIYFDKIGQLTALVGTDVKYAEHLEYGTISMAARPFFRPAVDAIKPKYIGRLERAIGDALK